MTQLYIALGVWFVCALLVLVGMGIASAVMLDSSLSEHLAQWQRILMVVLAPITVICFVAFCILVGLKLVWALLKLVLGK